ncbi:MAG: hypothetical protein ACLPYS_01605 [Vulcanimicrobiaceae bacterium]
MSPTEQEDFQTRCAAAAQAAHSAGVSYAKVPNQFAIAVTGKGAAPSTFPIVTDKATWRETTPDEAFFVVLGDVYAWVVARLDDAKLKALENNTVVLKEIDRESREQLANLRALVVHAGSGDALKTMWAAAGLNVVALNGLALS